MFQLFSMFIAEEIKKMPSVKFFFKHPVCHRNVGRVGGVSQKLTQNDRGEGGMAKDDRLQ